MQDSLYKKQGNKRVIDSPVMTTSSEDINLDNNSDKIIESEACINFLN